MEYSLADRTGTESAVVFINHLYAKENNIGISYIDGPFEAVFDTIMLPIDLYHMNKKQSRTSGIQGKWYDMRPHWNQTNK